MIEKRKIMNEICNKNYISGFITASISKINIFSYICGLLSKNIL